MSNRIRCAILGTGSLAMAVLHRLADSPELAPAWMVGDDSASAALAEMGRRGLGTSERGVAGLIPHVIADTVKIAFATEAFEPADLHRLCALGVLVIDMTRRLDAPLCVPAANGSDFAAKDPRCLGVAPAILQVGAPLVRAVSRVQKVVYAEVFANLSLASPATPCGGSIDAFDGGAAAALVEVARVASAKVALTSNPAPVASNALWCSITCVAAAAWDRESLEASLASMVAELRQYLPTFSVSDQRILCGARAVIVATLPLEGAGRGGEDWDSAVLAASAVRSAEGCAERIRSIRRLSSDFDFLPT